MHYKCIVTAYLTCRTSCTIFVNFVEIFPGDLDSFETRCNKEMHISRERAIMDSVLNDDKVKRRHQTFPALQIYPLSLSIDAIKNVFGGH